jgi:hypothetical protein
MKLEFSYQVSKNSQISNFKKIRPMTAELLHLDRALPQENYVVFGSFTSTQCVQQQLIPLGHR